LNGEHLTKEYDVLDPTQLFRIETDTPLAEQSASTLVVSLGGFIDAGNTQKLMTAHMLGTLEHTVVASFDVDQLLDYRGRRPMMTFDRDRYSEYDASSTPKARRSCCSPAPSPTTSGSASARPSASSRRTSASRSW